MNERQMCLNDTNQQKGVSDWLTVLPVVDNGFTLNNEQFCDIIRIRYECEIKNLPITCVCVCGSKFTIDHSMRCKKGDFITLRHNNILGEICKDVAFEQVLLPLTGEKRKRNQQTLTTKFDLMLLLLDSGSGVSKHLST